MNVKRGAFKVVFAACLAALIFTSSGIFEPVASAEATNRPQRFQSLDTLIGNWLNRSDLAHSMIGVEVMALPSGKILYSLNSSRRFVSASTAKVLTTACAFDTLGGAYKYKTRLYALGNVANKKVLGNLILAPAEDPTFIRDDLDQLFVALRQRGITQIEGSLRLNPIKGGFDRWSPNWLTEDWGQEWMPPSSNLVVDRNVAPGNIVLRGFKINNLGPDSANNAMRESLLTAGNAAAWIECDNNNRQLDFFRSPGISLAAPLVVANPSDFNCALATTIAQDHGIKLSNRTAPNSSANLITLLAEHESIPLWTIVRITLHESDNLYAQQLLRTLGLPKVDPDVDLGLLRAATDWQAPTLEDRGLLRLGAWLTKIGVPPQEVVLFDGCGLSRKNGISPHALNTVLKYMATNELNGPYLALLKRNSPVSKGSFAYKTGTMDTVRSICGVLDTVGGQTCAVTIMVNGHVPSVRTVSAEVNSLIALLDSIKAIKVIKQPSAGTELKKSSEPPTKPGDSTGTNVQVETTLVELDQKATSGTVPRAHRRKRHH